MINPYLWIAIVGGIIAFLMGAGVGMNDLANSFGTTYGARILTLLQICILASICEFAGAVSLGGAVTSTISGGIADPAQFADKPYVFMYGMLCAGGAAFCWLAIATWLVLPVSSTHSICGGVIGFGLVFGGANGVKWASPQDSFPFVGGVVPVIASWFISPLCAGAFAALIYGAVRFFVLRPKNSVKRAIYSLPIVVSVTFFLEAFFVLFKGAKSRLHWGAGRAAWVAACIGAGAGGLACIFIPILFRRLRHVQLKREAKEQAAVDAEAGEAELQLQTEAAQADGKCGSPNAPDAALCPDSNEPMTYSDVMDAGVKPREGKEVDGNVVREDSNDQDDFGDSPDSSGAARQHRYDNEAAAADTAPVFSAEESDKGDKDATPVSDLVVDTYNSDAEYVYRYLQIFTAICASFAHGASDVSNAVGPFAAIYEVYQSRSVAGISSNEAPIWILCIGGAGIVVGLSTFGIRIMRLLGEKITVITPSRGFSAELSAALVVSFASAFGIPVSSTHSITGAVVAISIVDVGFRKVRWMMVLKMYAGWVFTLVITAVASAAFFAQGVYTPNV